VKLRFWPANVTIGLIGAVALLGLAGVGYECTCGKGPANEQLRAAPERVEDGSLLGLSTAEIEALFGRPNDGAIIAGWDSAYFLGRDDACIDSRWLVLEFDEEHRVARAAITQD